MTAVLSKRMQAVADMVPAGHIAADIGCDHGFVSIYLVQNGICPRVYAADVRPGPLARAKEHICRSGLQERIIPVLSDGLLQVPVGAGEADVMIAAGMGGKLTVRILSDAVSKTEQLSACILEPQSEVWLVRRCLAQLRFTIIQEDMVFEDGKYYPVMLAVNDRKPENTKAVQEACSRNRLQKERMREAGFSEEEYCQACACFGASLIREKNAVLLSFLEHTITQNAALLRELPVPEKEGEDAGKPERIRRRTEELENRISLAGKVLDLMRNQ